MSVDKCRVEFVNTLAPACEFSSLKSSYRERLMNFAFGSLDGSLFKSANALQSVESELFNFLNVGRFEECRRTVIVNKRLAFITEDE